MKSPGWSITGFVFLVIFTTLFATPLSAQLDAAALDGATAPTTNLAGPADLRTAVSRWQPKTSSEHQTEWFSVRYATNAVTGRVRATTNSYVEIATGLNRPDTNGGWRRASAAFQITATGAEAALAGHRVRLAGNINSAGAVQVEKAGVILQGHPLCIAYYDPVDGRSELLAELKDAAGWLVSSNEIVYSNCFNGIRASIRYRNAVNGLEQDLIFHERPPVTPAELGFSDKTRIELFTEWVGDTPLPQQETRLLATEKDTELRKEMVEPDFTDSTLTFGSMRMSRGKAFSEGTQADGGKAAEEIVVGKRFEIIDGRKILIEALPVQRVQSMLNELPLAPLSGTLTNAALRPLTNAAGAQVATTRPLTRPAGTLSPLRGEGRGEGLVRSLPAKRLARTKSDSRIQTAAVDSALRISNPTLESAPAFVLDWQLLSTGGLTDYIFQPGVTYLCSAPISLNGTTRIRGAVVKFAPLPASAGLYCSGSVICETEPYRPAYFVSKFDATVGEVVDYSNTTPAPYAIAIEVGTTGNKLKHLRVRHAEVAIKGWDVDVRHSQFIHCGTGFYMPLGSQGSGPCRVGNVLVYACERVFAGTYYNAIATHLTAHSCDALAEDGYDRSTAHLINSLVVGVSNGDFAPLLTSSQMLSGTPPVFQTVGSASHYLANSTYRGQGTTTIDATLLAELKQTTTYPPLLRTGTLSVNTTLAPAPQVVRNASGSANPDLGYAYDVMDHLAKGLQIENGSPTITLLLTNGVVVGVDPTAAGYAIRLGQNTELISTGSPLLPNRLLSADHIQENALALALWTPYVTLWGVGLASAPATACLNFTDVAVLAAGQASASGYFQQLNVRDCQMRGGLLSLSPDNPAQQFAFTNTLFEGVGITVHAYAPATIEACRRNRNWFCRKGCLANQAEFASSSKEQMWAKANWYGPSRKMDRPLRVLRRTLNCSTCRICSSAPVRST